MARGSGISIAIASETGAFEKGIKSGVIDPIEDADDALKKLGKNKGPEQLEEQLRDAQEATENLADETKRASDAIEKNFRAAYRKVGDSGTDSLHKLDDVTEEVSSEAMQNLSEVASSFSGDMDSAIDLVQGTLGGLASGIGGPLGIAFGLAAAGLGAILTGLMDAEERAEALREKAREIAAEAVLDKTDTETFLTTMDQVIDRIQQLEQAKSTDFRWFWEEDPTQLEQWQGALEELGMSGADVQKVLGGSRATLQQYTDGVQDARDALQEQADAMKQLGRGVPESERAKKQAILDTISTYDTVLKYLNDEITLRDEAGDSAERQYDAGISAALEAADAEAAYAEAAQQAADERQAAIENVAASVETAYDSMRTAATTYATDESGALDINRWLEYVNEHAAAVATYQSNISAIQLTPEQWSNLLEMPEDQRMQWVAQFAALPAEAQAPFAAALNDIGGGAGSGAAVAFDDAFTPEARVDVDVKVDTTKQEAEIAKLARDRTATLTVKIDDQATAAVDEIVRDINSRVAYITVGERKTWD